MPKKQLLLPCRGTAVLRTFSAFACMFLRWCQWICYCERGEAVSQSFGDCHGLTASQ